jgi:hypothetical protein
MVGGTDELIEMLHWSESLRNSSRRVLNDVHSLVAGDSVVQGRSCDGQFHRSIGQNLRPGPSIFDIPVDCEHVVGVSPSKVVIFLGFGLPQLDLSFGDFNVVCLKRVNFQKNLRRKIHS